MSFLVALLLVGSGVVLWTGASPAGASTVSVANCNDSGAGSLRDTVAGASAGTTIDFAPSPACHLITLTSGFIELTHNMTIDGPGASNLAISGNNDSGVLRVDSGVTASISGLTIEDANENAGIADPGEGIRNFGTLTVTDSTLSDNTGELQGGGIYNGGTLTVTGSTLSGNTADEGGGIFNGVGTLTVTDSTLSDNTGGGIDNGDAGTLTVTGCTFSGNGSAGVDGSAIVQDDGGTITVTNSTLSGNTGTQDVADTTAGGGIFTSGGTLTVTDSTISGNSATGGGGGIQASSSTLTVTDSTISGNSASGTEGDGGGIDGDGTFTITGSTLSDNTASSSGGGIDYTGFGALHVTDSTLSGNAVGGGEGNVVGGAIANFGTDGPVTLTHTTLSGNTAPVGDGGGISTFDGSTTLIATIVANSGSGLDCTNNVIFSPPTDGGYNLDDDGSCGFSGGNHSLSDTPAGLNPSGLANNGGPTRTIALEPFSAAIDHVTSASDCTGNDQTGVVWSTPCNIGATAGPTAVPGPYSPLAPIRICDSRPVSGFSPANQCNAGAGNPIGAIAAGGTKTINVANAGGTFGVPADALSVVLNVTAVNPAAGFMTVFPAGAAQPNASNLNYPADETLPNLVQVGIGSGGDVSFFSSSHTDLLVDVEGYTAPTASGGSGAGLYNALSVPARLCDTRAPSSFTPVNQCDGPGSAAGTLAAGVAKNVAVTNGSSIPNGATAAVLNVTVVNPAAAGFLTAYPQGTTAPNASNLNFGVGQTTTNRVIVPLSASGKISLVSSVLTDAIVDVSGYYSAASGTGAEFSPEPAPVRVCDTRAVSSFSPQNQCSGQHVTSGTSHELTLKVTNGGAVSDGVPANAKAVVVNLTAIAPSASTFLAVFPGPDLPSSSDLNPAAGETRANLVVATINQSTGKISVFNNTGSLDVIVDVLGWYS
jgi:Right handed beta helix region